jgi:peroxiredoxin family protein
LEKHYKPDVHSYDEETMKTDAVEFLQLQSDIRQLQAKVERLEREQKELSARLPEDRASIVIFSGDLDKVLAGFIIATGAAATGLATTIFFTFWGLCALKKTRAPSVRKKDIKEKMLALMTPSNSMTLRMSRMNFMGIGAKVLRSMMKDKGIASLEELMDVARDLGVRFIACTMSMDAMGLLKEELVDGLDYGSVGTYMADASRSKVTLFI